MRTFVRAGFCLLMIVLVAPPPASADDGSLTLPEITLPLPPSCLGAYPGDADNDGTINIGDVVTLVNFLCHNPDEIPLDNPANGDVNADCAIDIDDVYYLIDWIFRGGPAPMDCVCGDPDVGGCTATCDIVDAGDANGDGSVNISDVVYIINFLCHSGPPPYPLGNGDPNADCIINLDDVYYLIDYIFHGGPAPDCICGLPSIGGCEASCAYVTPGDANNDGSLNIADVVYLVNLLCHDGPPPVPLGNGDVNGDCIIDMDDAMYMVHWIYEGGPAPMDCECGAPTIGECALYCDGVLPGDANGDESLNISDVVFLVNFLCHEGPAPDPLGNGDANGDCIIDMDDIDYLISYMYEGGPAPADCVCGVPAVGECSVDKSGAIGSHPELSTLLDDGVPSSIGLWQNNPNPFNPKTTISFSLPTSAHVRLEILDVAGRRLATLVDEIRGPGLNTVTWDGTDTSGANVGAGMYFYRIVSGDVVKTRKMMLIK